MTVILHITDEHSEYLDRQKIKSLVNKYLWPYQPAQSKCAKKFGKKKNSLTRPQNG